jgi:hypothetical protein
MLSYMLAETLLFLTNAGVISNTTCTLILPGSSTGTTVIEIHHLNITACKYSLLNIPTKLSKYLEICWLFGTLHSGFRGPCLRFCSVRNDKRIRVIVWWDLRIGQHWRSTSRNRSDKVRLQVDSNRVVCLQCLQSSIEVCYERFFRWSQQLCICLRIFPVFLKIVSKLY